MCRADNALLPHGGYKNLRSYVVAKTVYEATVVFCRRFYPNDHRMKDQMIQAARSGVRNISEGSGAAATSRKTEMKLTNVALASLRDELLPDFEAFLQQRGLAKWDKDSSIAKAMRDRLRRDSDGDVLPSPGGQERLAGLTGLPEFVALAEPELAGNAMICAVHQATYLLRRQINSQARQFSRHGGFSENLYRTRAQSRTARKGKI